MSYLLLTPICAAAGCLVFRACRYDKITVTPHPTAAAEVPVERTLGSRKGGTTASDGRGRSGVHQHAKTGNPPSPTRGLVICTHYLRVRRVRSNCSAGLEEEVAAAGMVSGVSCSGRSEQRLVELLNQLEQQSVEERPSSQPYVAQGVQDPAISGIQASGSQIPAPEATALASNITKLQLRLGGAWPENGEGSDAVQSLSIPPARQILDAVSSQNQTLLVASNRTNHLQLKKSVGSGLRVQGLGPL